MNTRKRYLALAAIVAIGVGASTTRPVDAQNNVHISQRLRGMLRIVAVPSEGP